MTDVAAQILARITALEDVARAAADSREADESGHWQFVEYDYEGARPQPLRDVLPLGRGYDPGEPWSDLCNLFDPAHVLRLCAALRAVVTEVEGWQHYVCEDGWYTCGAATEEREGEDCIDDARRGTGCDCGRDARADRTLSAVAGVWGVSGVDA
jgi:hypothetical protein